MGHPLSASRCRAASPKPWRGDEGAAGDCSARSAPGALSRCAQGTGVRTLRPAPHWPSAAPKGSPVNAQPFRGAGRRVPLCLHACPALSVPVQESSGSSEPLHPPVCVRVDSMDTAPPQGSGTRVCTPQSTLAGEAPFHLVASASRGLQASTVAFKAKGLFPGFTVPCTSSARAERAPAALPVLHGSHVPH